MAVAAAPYGLLSMAGCGFGAHLADRVLTGGFDELTRGWPGATTAMLVMLAAGAVVGACSAVRQIWATRRLIQHVARSVIPPPAGSPPNVDVLDHDEAFAFTFGLGSPRIALSRGLVERLAPDELEAVLAHERYHLAARDPLKLLIARVAARTCFFLPAVGHLVARYVAGRELAADRRALCGSDRPALAGALFKVVAGPEWTELETAAAMAGPELLAVRIDQLELGAEPPLPALPAAAVAVSAAVLGLFVVVVGGVALQGGLSTSASDGASMSAADVGLVIAGGLVCGSGWVWLAAVAFRRLARSALTTAHTPFSTTRT